jgi:phage tail sheath protein FI
MKAKREIIDAVKDSIQNLLNAYLFEANDELTRNSITATAKHYLSDYVNNRIIHDYKVVCDETNNPPEDIDRGRLTTDVYIQPQRSVEYTIVRAVIQPQGAEFEYTPEVTFETEEEAYNYRLGL